MCGNGGNDAARQARLLEDQRQARIAEGQSAINKTFGQFDDKFYTQRQQDYTNFALPQLYSQMQQVNRQGAYGLANRGLGVSSAANQFGSRLGAEANVQKQGIVDSGIAQAQQLRKDVEGQRSSLLAQLQASADPVSASQQALQSAGAYSLPSVFTPIGNLFGNFSQLYANSQLNKVANQDYRPNYGLNNSPLGSRAYSIR